MRDPIHLRIFVRQRDAAREFFGVPVAFDNHQDLVNSNAVDVVAITVKVPHHLELATAALGAGPFRAAGGICA